MTACGRKAFAGKPVAGKPSAGQRLVGERTASGRKASRRKASGRKAFGRREREIKKVVARPAAAPASVLRTLTCARLPAHAFLRLAVLRKSSAIRTAASPQSQAA